MNDNEERIIIECHISYEPVLRKKLKKIRTKVSKILKKVGSKIYWYYKSMFFSGLLLMLVLFNARPLEDAIEEYDQVMEMDIFHGYIQMLLNNEKYYKNK